MNSPPVGRLFLLGGYGKWKASLWEGAFWSSSYSVIVVRQVFAATVRVGGAVSRLCEWLFSDEFTAGIKALSLCSFLSSSLCRIGVS